MLEPPLPDEVDGDGLGAAEVGVAVGAAGDAAAGDGDGEAVAVVDGLAPTEGLGGPLATGVGNAAAVEFVEV